MTRSDHPSQTHLSSSIFCLFGGGGVLLNQDQLILQAFQNKAIWSSS